MYVVAMHKAMGKYGKGVQELINRWFSFAYTGPYKLD
jgi:hypothetical protein